MSSKLRVKCQKNDAGRLNWIEIYKKGRRKPLRLDFVWDAEGLTREIEFSGRRQDMPSLADIMLMFNESFIERIGLVKLINVIEKIDELTLLKVLQKVNEITKLVELTTLKTVEKIESVKIIGKDASCIERRSTISNNGTAASWNTKTGDNRAGKFFTRGCMGFINTIDVYCKDDGAAGGTITVYISPNSSLGYTASATITVPAGGSASWRSATFNRMWLSDKLFIFIVCSTTDINYGRDLGGDPDQYYSTDAGATWATGAYRNWFRVVMKGETEGDANVTGTVNTIEIPSKSSCTAAQVLTAAAGVGQEDLVTVEGCGELTFISWFTDSDADRDNLHPRIYCDGVQVFPFGTLTFAAIEAYRVDNAKDSPAITWSKWDTTGHFYCLQVKVIFPFKRQLKIGIENIDAGNPHNAEIYALHPLTV